MCLFYRLTVSAHVRLVFDVIRGIDISLAPIGYRPRFQTGQTGIKTKCLFPGGKDGAVCRIQGIEFHVGIFVIGFHGRCMEEIVGGGFFRCVLVKIGFSNRRKRRDF